MARRGSRNGRKNKAALNDHDTDSIRLVLVEWMEETARYDREREEKREAWIKAEHEKRLQVQASIEARRAERKATAQRRTESRRKALLSKIRKSPISRDTLVIKGLPIRGPNAYRVDAAGHVVERY